MIKTSESVLKGHPDKICDGVADYILTELLKQDKDTRAGIECLIKDELLVIAGEVSTKAVVNYKELARNCLDDIGLDSHEFEILEKISVQSSDIALGVDIGGAGNQGIMYGYAEGGTEELMPLPVVLSRKLAVRLDELNTKETTLFGKDGKCQVSVKYDKDIPVAVTSVVVSAQTKQGVPRVFYEPLILEILESCVPSNLKDHSTLILVNSTGEFVKGGSYADSGLTGRKLQCDSYGTVVPHGGGAFSGKDYTKVDRSGAYYCRYVAKALVKAEFADTVEVSVAYAIGVPYPVAIDVKATNSKYTNDELRTIVNKVFVFSPSNIIKELKLK